MPWTAALQVSLSVEFSRQGYWSGLPFPSQFQELGCFFLPLGPFSLRRCPPPHTHTLSLSLSLSLSFSLGNLHFSCSTPELGAAEDVGRNRLGQTIETKILHDAGQKFALRFYSQGHPNDSSGN